LFAAFCELKWYCRILEESLCGTDKSRNDVAIVGDISDPIVGLLRNRRHVNVKNAGVFGKEKRRRNGLMRTPNTLQAAMIIQGVGVNPVPSINGNGGRRDGARYKTR
jgi:hypothetical protein